MVVLRVLGPAALTVADPDPETPAELPPPKLCHPARPSAPFEWLLPALVGCEDTEPGPLLLSATPIRVEAAALPCPETSAPDLKLPEGRAPFRPESRITCFIRAACSWNARRPEGGVLRVKKRPEFFGQPLHIPVPAPLRPGSAVPCGIPPLTFAGFPYSCRLR